MEEKNYTEKEIFIEALKKRTKHFAVDVRAACRARSKAEFYSKICIVVEESDESEYWLEIISEARLSDENAELNRLIKEANEITKIMTKAKNSSYLNINNI